MIITKSLTKAYFDLLSDCGALSSTYFSISGGHDIFNNYMWIVIEQSKVERYQFINLC